MKEVFEDLILLLKLHSDHYFYEAEDGSDVFDPTALYSEIRGFAEEFQKQIN
jgi:hypothetical protein